MGWTTIIQSEARNAIINLELLQKVTTLFRSPGGTSLSSLVTSYEAALETK
jgi:hypothetical protein